MMVGPRISPERLALFAQRLEEGWSFNEIVRTYGCSFDTLLRHFPGQGWTEEQRIEFSVAIRNAKRSRTL